MTVRKGGGARQPGDLSIAGSRFATDLGPVITYPAICTIVSLLSLQLLTPQIPELHQIYNSYSANFFLWSQYLQRDPRVAWVCITGAGSWKCYFTWVMKQLVQDRCSAPILPLNLSCAGDRSSLVVYINHSRCVYALHFVMLLLKFIFSIFVNV